MILYHLISQLLLTSSNLLKYKYIPYLTNILYEPQSVKTSLNDEVVKFELIVHSKSLKCNEVILQIL